MAGDSSLATTSKFFMRDRTDRDMLYQLLVNLACLKGQREMNFVKQNTKTTLFCQSNKF